MPDIETERAHLALAERDLREGEKRMLRQEELVVRLKAEGLDSTQAENLLRIFHDTLQTWKAHREQILRMIADLGG